MSPEELKKQITQKSVKKPRGKEQNEKKKNKERSRKEIGKLYREKVKQPTKVNLELEGLEFDITKTPFKNRMGQWRALRKITESLSKTPVKHAAVLSAYTKVQKSPIVQILRNMNVIKSPEEKRSMQ
jgi:hypothetical protein